MEELKKFYSGKKVLVTGGAGCIGSCLVEKLDEFGAQISILDNMMRGQEAVRNLEGVLNSTSTPPKIFIKDITDVFQVKNIFKKENGFDLTYRYFKLVAQPSRLCKVLALAGSIVRLSAHDEVYKIEPALGKLETRFRTFEFVILKLSRVSDFVLRI